MNVDPVTDSQIQDLSIEAGNAGDTRQVEFCELALEGDDYARTQCAKVISHASMRAAEDS